jgi:hypothetical protein
MRIISLFALFAVLLTCSLEAKAATPTLDASGSFTAQGSGGTSHAVTMSTTSTNDECFIFVVAGRTATPSPTVSGISGGSLAWTLRSINQTNKAGNFMDYEEWVAPCATSLSAVSMTVTWTGGTIDDYAIVAFGVHGAFNPSSPFDNNVSLPGVTGNGSTTGVGLTGISTSQAHDFFIGVLAATGGTFAAFSGVCLGLTSATAGIGTVNNNGGTNFAGLVVSYFTLSATVSNKTVAGTGSSCTSAQSPQLPPWAVGADAVTGDSNAPLSRERIMYVGH